MKSTKGSGSPACRCVQIATVEASMESMVRSAFGLFLSSMSYLR
jgi:hypothetical protein